MIYAYLCCTGRLWSGIDDVITWWFGVCDVIQTGVHDRLVRSIYFFVPGNPFHWGPSIPYRSSRLLFQLRRVLGVLLLMMLLLQINLLLLLLVFLHHSLRLVDIVPT